jgi:ribosomal protein S12 methylthiotransferase
MDFVDETRFERMGVFTYSPEPGTPAMRLDAHLPEEVKIARQNDLMEKQQEIAFEFAESMIDYELDVVIDGPAGENLWAGRTYADAPDIDATVYVAGEKLQIGQRLPVVLTGREGYDWVGEVADEDL